MNNYCPQCGTKQEAVGSFCSNCGYKLPQDENIIGKSGTEPITSPTDVKNDDPINQSSRDTSNLSENSQFNFSNTTSNQSFTVNEFAQKIRKQYPGDYDDLSDSQLVTLWLKKYPNDENKINFSNSVSPIHIKSEKKIKPYWYWIGGISIILIIIVSISIYNEYKYPKSEFEFVNLYCDKFWKTSNIQLDELYYNGKYIHPPSGNPITNSLYADEGSIFKKLQDDLNEEKDYDDFFILKKISDNRFWEYSQSYSKNKQSHTYSIDFPKLNKTSARFSFVYNEGNHGNYFVNNGESTGENFYYKNCKNDILSISEQELNVKSDFTMVVDNKEIRFLIQTTYIPTQPDPKYLERYNTEYTIAKSQINIDPNSNSMKVDTTALY